MNLYYLRKTATLLWTGILLSSSAWVHGQTPNTWQQKTDLLDPKVASGGAKPTARYGAVNFAINGKGYMGTGFDGRNKSDFWAYDPTTDTWAQKADFAGGARFHAVGFAINGKGYLGTGFDGDHKQDFWEYDPGSNTWTQKASFGGTARYGAVGFALNGKGYLGTGMDTSYDANFGHKQDFWEYNPTTDTWTQKADFSGGARYQAVGFTINSKAYLGTGVDKSHRFKQDFWEYDPATDAWTQKAAFGGTARQHAVGFSLYDKGYLGTGYDGSDKQDFWEYNPASDTWSQKTDFGGVGRSSAVGFAINGKGYLGGGSDSNYKPDFWEYTPAASLSISHLDADNNQPTNNSIKPYLQLANESTSPIPYSEITVRYWLTVEDFAPLTNLSVYWAQLGTDKVKLKYVALPSPQQGALGYIEYSFDASAGNLAANSNSGPIQSGIGKQNWTALNESDDYSYGDHSSYTKTDRITLYRNGNLVWGVEPPSVIPVQRLKVYSQNLSSATTNSISTYIQVRNEGNTPTSYQKMTVRYWLTADGVAPLNFYLDYAVLGNANVKGKVVKPSPPLAGADSYLELSFDAGLGMFYPLSGTGNIQYRLAKSDWSNLNQADDFSYQAANTMQENSRMTVYLDGMLVYGSEPSSANARIAAAEPGTDLKVTVLSNPVQGSEVVFDVEGAADQPLRVFLTDLQGRVLVNQTSTGQEVRQRHRLSVASQSAGVLLLRVSTPTQWQTLRLIKSE